MSEVLRGTGNRFWVKSKCFHSLFNCGLLLLISAERVVWVSTLSGRTSLWLPKDLINHALSDDEYLIKLASQCVDSARRRQAKLSGRLSCRSVPEHTDVAAKIGIFSGLLLLVGFCGKDSV